MPPQSALIKAKYWLHRLAAATTLPTEQSLIEECHRSLSGIESGAFQLVFRNLSTEHLYT